MALQVWLPLSGSTTNLGLGDYTINESGTVRYIDGNLGNKALHAGEGSVAIQLNPTFTNLSVAFWFKSTGNSADSVLTQIGDTKVVYDGTNTYIANGDGLVTSGTKLFTVTRTSLWNHVAIVADGSNVKVYLNGELVNTITQAKTVAAAFTTNKNIYIGSDSTSSANWIGSITDFKVFDNALSLRFVKGLAEGLVVEYLFNHGGYGNDNILVGGEKDVNISTSSAYTAIEDDTIYANLSQNNTYTLSADTSGTWASENVTSGQIASKKYTGIEVYQKNGDTINNRTFYDLSKTGYAVIDTTNSGRYYIGFLAYSDGTTTIDVTISHIKLEVGDTATPYVPPKGTEEYEITGLDQVVIDNSGNSLNGTIGAKEPTWVSDTPVYNGGYDFNNSGYIESADIDLTEIANNFTVSVWVNASAGKAIVTDDIEVDIPSSALDNKWHLITVTPSAIYVDGEKSSEVATTLSGTKFYFGTAANKTTDTLTGSLCDFRLYSTILSDDQIKNLFHRRYGIDNFGQLYLGGFKEDSNTKVSFDDSGVLKSASLNNVNSSDQTSYTDISKFNISNKFIVNAVDVIEV